MFPSDEKYLVLDDAGKIAKTEAFFESIGSKKELILNLQKDLEEKIDEVLKNEEPINEAQQTQDDSISNRTSEIRNSSKVSRFLELLSDEKYAICKMYSYDLSCLQLYEVASKMEENNGGPYTLSSQYSFSDLKWAYQGIIFYLRRIEFDFSLDEQLELFTFLEQRGISFYYLYYVFTSPVIADKCKVALGLVDLFSRIGNALWTNFYLEWVESNYDATDGMRMALACRLLELGNISKALSVLEKIEASNPEIESMKQTLRTKIKK